jgi:PAS domain S-box-containing protein
MNEVRLLLADKNLSYLEIARKMLRFHDEAYQVDVATSEEECLEKLKKNHYDLLLLDYDIDGKMGLEILSRIIGNESDVPIVMLVDEGREDIAFKAIEKGAYDYIMKVRGYLTALPFTVGKVLEKKKRRIVATTYDEEPFDEPEPPFSIADEDIMSDETLPDNQAASQEAYFILDRKGRFITSNRMLEELLKYSEDELLELNLSDLIPAEREHSYYQWITTVDRGSREQSFKTEIISKHGDIQSAEIAITPMRDRNNEIISYKGRLKVIVPDNGSLYPLTGNFDQARMIDEMVQLIHDSHNIPFNQLLERISQIVCQLFMFKRATLALLDRRRKTFIKQMMIGYTNGKTENQRILEVPQDVIDRVFVNQSKIKVIYHDHDAENNNSLQSIISERRTQPRRSTNQWHPQDIIIFNLVDHHDKTFGYISLDEPLYPVVPPREIFHNMELFSSLASLAIENYYNFAALEKRNRRLKQLLLSSNLFRLHLSISEMMKEIVWAIKFSMNYKLVVLGFINRNSKEFQVKSVACDDRIKTVQLKELTIPVDQIQTLFKKEYRRGKSYLITRSEPALRRMKSLYYDRKIDVSSNRYWNWYILLTIPIYNSKGKMIGYIMIDDPVDCLLPTAEDIHTLEILANQVSVAIENRLTYVRLQEQASGTIRQKATTIKEKSEGGIKKLVDKFFK